MHLPPERHHASRWYGALLLWLCLLAPAVMAETELVVANSNWEPYYGENLEGHGIAGRLLTRIFDDKDIRLVFQTMPWAQAMRRLALGKADLVATAYATPGRRQAHFMSDAYDQSRQYFYQRSGAGIVWQDLEDLADYPLGLIRDHAYSQEVDSARFLKKRYFNSEQQLLAVLEAGRVDLVLMDERVAAHELAGMEPAVAESVEQVPGGLRPRSLYLLFSGRNPANEMLRDRFNEGLKALKESGELEPLRLGQ